VVDDAPDLDALRTQLREKLDQLGNQLDRNPLEVGPNTREQLIEVEAKLRMALNTVRTQLGEPPIESDEQARQR
jgi:hypothetical protein